LRVIRYTEYGIRNTEYEKGAYMQKRRVLTVVIAIIVIVGIFAAFASYSAWKIRSMDVGEVDLSSISDGVYKGEESYFGFTCRVEVKVKDHQIVDIKVFEDRESEYLEKARAVTQNVLQGQSLEVDTVTGATVTSKAILKAVENALLKKE